MGMSASQARLLFISSRISDLELRSQQISNTKIRLADESEQVANDYTKALNKTKLTLTNPVDQTKSQLTYASIMTPKGQMSGAYNIQTADGKVVVTSQVASAFSSAKNVSEFLANMSVEKSDTSIAAEEYNQAAAELNEARTNTNSFLKSKGLSVNSDGSLKFPTTKTTTVNTVDNTNSARGTTKTVDGGTVSTAETTSSAGGGRTTKITTSTSVNTSESVSSSGKSQTTTVTKTGVYKIDMVEGTNSVGQKTKSPVSGSDSYKVTTTVVTESHVYTRTEESQLQAQYNQLKNIERTAENKYNAAKSAYENSGNGVLNSSSSGNEYYYTNLYNDMKANGYQAYSTASLNNPEFLQVQLEQGNWYIGKKNEDGKYEQTSISSNTMITEESDDKNLAKAEAEYNAKTAKINKKEKLLDMKLKEVDTEHSALKTEFDSVKSLISDNIDKSFNLFS